MKPHLKSIHYEVFGIGSAHGVDQVGWRVIDQLQQEAVELNGIHRLQVPLDLLTHASASASASASAPRRPWIIVDACLGECVGKIHCWRWPELPESASLAGQVSSHGIGLLDVLRMGQELSVLPDAIWIFGIEVGAGSKVACSAQTDSWDPSHELHLAIIRSAEQIAVRLSVEIDPFANRHPPAQLQTLNTRTQPG